MVNISQLAEGRVSKVEDEVEVSEENELRNASKDELNHRLQEAIENEAYELASKIRDELNRRG
jgi:protein-arginine kinase activator protein McsA